VEAKAVAYEPIVVLVFAEDPSMQAAVLFFRQGREEADHPCKGIGPVQQAGRTLDHLRALDIVRVYLYAMLIAPLLAFLAQAVIQRQYTVIPQAPDKRL